MNAYGAKKMKSVKSARNMKKKKSSKSLASSNMKRNKGGENMDDIRDTLRVAGLFAAGVLIGTVCGLLLAPCRVLK